MLRNAIRSSDFRLWLIVAVHVCLIPIAIAATLYAYGFENALTLNNQCTWTPIIAAQSILLAMLLAFGSGSLKRRALYFLAGSLALTWMVVWAYSMLSTFPEPKWKTFLLQMRINSLWILLPTWMSAIVLLLVRPFSGGLERRGNADRTHQFSLQDVFIVMTLSAVGVAWFSFVARIPLQAVNAKHVWDVIPLTLLAFAAIERCFGILAIVWLIFSGRPRWIGVLALLALLAWLGVSRTYPWSDAWAYFYLAFTWTIVLATAIAYRLLGFRLTNAKVSSAKPRTLADH
jgi:hypothetical protein